MGKCLRRPLQRWNQAVALTARSEAQAIRVALVYALLDGQSAIGRHHLEAALEIVRYSNASVKYIFGDAVGNATADTILRTLRSNPEGLTRTEINNLFGRNAKAADIARASSWTARPE